MVLWGIQPPCDGIWLVQVSSSAHKRCGWHLWWEGNWAKTRLGVGWQWWCRCFGFGPCPPVGCATVCCTRCPTIPVRWQLSLRWWWCHWRCRRWQYPCQTLWCSWHLRISPCWVASVDWLRGWCGLCWLVLWRWMGTPIFLLLGSPCRWEGWTVYLMVHRCNDLGHPRFPLQILRCCLQLWMGLFRPLFLSVVPCHQLQVCIAFFLGELWPPLCWLGFPFLAVVPICFSIFLLSFFNCGFLLQVWLWSCHWCDTAFMFMLFNLVRQRRKTRIKIWW